MIPYEDIMSTEDRRVESENEVRTYIAQLKYALEHGAEINFQKNRRVDEERGIIYTNRYTVATLFPGDDPVKALRRELATLTTAEYQYTVKDRRFPNRSEMRVFGKNYSAHEVCKSGGDVYIKIRVELMTGDGNHTAFVMSFHFAEIPFCDSDFPYRDRK